MGEVEALAQAVYDTGLVNLPLADSLDVDCHDVARAVLAAGLLADHSKCRAIGEWYGVPAHAWGEQR